ncbi:metal ABC transporter substrate-binding protein [Verrucomicrobiales bacterium BCK34]|nr:metal ABC transporter substrate-binding protein [Verrucomicrobiales bacterium BCK34]
MRTGNLAIQFIAAACLISGLSTPAPVQGAEKVKVVSVNYPLHYFAERIGTDSFAIDYLVAPDVDPAFWEPEDEALMAFQKADIVIRNGADYAKWMNVVTLPSTTKVDTSRAFSDRLIKVEGGAHSHGDGAVHSHAGTAFTTWIDFSQAAIQAEAIAKRMTRYAPAEAKQIEENLAALKGELGELDQQMKSLGKKLDGQSFVVSHPIYQYWSRAYGIKIDSLEWEPEMKLGEKEIVDLKAVIGKSKPQWMIWEGEPTKENVEALAQLGLSSLVFSPAANRPEKGDWMQVMQQNIKNLEEVLKP